MAIELTFHLFYTLAMVEHLARAAAELHQKRTGKKTADEGLLNSPAMNTEEVFHYNKELSDKERHTSPKKGGPGKSVAWSEEEINQVEEIVEKVGKDDPNLIAKMMGTRNEAQVREYLQTMEEMEKGPSSGSVDMAEETPRKKGGRGRKPPTTAMNTVPNANLDAKAMLEGSFVGL